MENSTHRELGFARIFYWTTSLRTAMRLTAFWLWIDLADLNTSCDSCEWWTRTSENRVKSDDDPPHVYRNAYSINNQHCSRRRADDRYHLLWLNCYHSTCNSPTSFRIAIIFFRALVIHFPLVRMFGYTPSGIQYYITISVIMIYAIRVFVCVLSRENIILCILRKIII